MAEVLDSADAFVTTSEQGNTKRHRKFRKERARGYLIDEARAIGLNDACSIAGKNFHNKIFIISDEKQLAPAIVRV